MRQHCPVAPSEHSENSPFQIPYRCSPVVLLPKGGYSVQRRVLRSEELREGTVAQGLQ